MSKYIDLYEVIGEDVILEAVKYFQEWAYTDDLKQLRKITGVSDKNILPAVKKLIEQNFSSMQTSVEYYRGEDLPLGNWITRMIHKSYQTCRASKWEHDVIYVDEKQIVVVPNAQNTLDVNGLSESNFRSIVAAMEFDGLFLPEKIEGDVLKVHKNVGFCVGRSNMLEADRVSMKDKISFAVPAGKSYPVRVEEGPGEESESVTMLLKADSYPIRNVVRHYLVSAWVGNDGSKKNPLIARKTGELEDSLAFWKEHALVYDDSKMGKRFMTTWDDILYGDWHWNKSRG